MKRSIVKIEKTGKLIAGILGLFISIVTVWEIIKSYSAKNISGKWYIKFTLEKCNHKPFVGGPIPK